MLQKRLDIELTYIKLCPCCKKRKVLNGKGRKTCGKPECQIAHHTKHQLKYWHIQYKPILKKAKDIQHIV